MQFSFFEELLRLLFIFCNNNSILFISIFDHSDYLIAYNFSFVEKRFTNVSNSFQKVLGYDQNNILCNGNFTSKIIHPHDRYILNDFLNQSHMLKNRLILSSNQPLITRTKFRARHVRGYWKYFIIFSMDYKNQFTNEKEKIGLIADEYVKPNLEVLLRDKDSTSIKTFISQRPSKNKHSNGDGIRITNRESEILELISDGMIAKDIAEKLNISLTTVISHRKNLISKLHVNNTAELISIASRLMLI